MCVCALIFVSFFRQSRLTEGVLFSTVRLSVRPSVRLFVRPVCLLPTLWTHYVENEWTDFDTHWYKWARASNGQLWGSGGQRSRSNKVEDLEAWRRHHSRPWFLVYSLYCVVFTILLCTYYAFLFFSYVFVMLQ